MKSHYFIGPAVACLATLTLFVGNSRPAFAEETTPTPAAPINDPIVLDKMAVSAIRERVEIYQSKADTVFDGLRLEKKIRYSQVIASSYDTSRFDLITTLLAKKKYRETIAKGHTFFCNYAAWDMDIGIL